MLTKINQITKLQDPAIVKPNILKLICELTNPEVVVEIGTQRHGASFTEDGQSTSVFERFSKEVHSVDNDENAISKAKTACGGRVNFHLQDGTQFLQNFPKHIDLLYLDGGDDPKETLEQFEAAKGKTIVVIDDCMDYAGNKHGKGTKVIEKYPNFLLTNHFGRYRMAIRAE